MLQSIEVAAKTEEEAIEKALEQLSMEREDVSVEVLERAKAGFLGLGASPAKVRVSYDDGKPEPASPVFQPEQRKTRAEQAREEAERKQRSAAKAKEHAARVVQPDRFQPEVLQGREALSAQQEKKTTSAYPERTRAGKDKMTHRSIVHPADECHDEKSEQIRSFLGGLLTHLLLEAKIKVYDAGEKRYQVILDGEKMGALIGRRGETLDAIQQITAYAVSHGKEDRIRIQMDAENYRAKREQALTHLAEKVAAKVIRYRRNVTLESMNAYERHIIHEALQNANNISTFSIGTEPNRRVVVAYDHGKVTPQGEE